MFLPNEIINLILSYREAHPVSLLMKESIKHYTGDSIKTSIFDNYYKHAIMKAQENIYIRSMCKLQKFSYIKSGKITKTKIAKKKKKERMDKCFDTYCKLIEKCKDVYEKNYKRLSGIENIEENNTTILIRNGYVV